MALAFERAQLLCLAGREFSCGHDRLSALRFELSAMLLDCPHWTIGGGYGHL
jgi:hypothetical protein